MIIIILRYKRLCIEESFLYWVAGRQKKKRAIPFLFMSWNNVIYALFTLSLPFFLIFYYYFFTFYERSVYGKVRKEKEGKRMFWGEKMTVYYIVVIRMEAIQGDGLGSEMTEWQQPTCQAKKFNLLWGKTELFPTSRIRKSLGLFFSSGERKNHLEPMIVQQYSLLTVIDYKHWGYKKFAGKQQIHTHASNLFPSPYQTVYYLCCFHRNLY